MSSAAHKLLDGVTTVDEAWRRCTAEASRKVSAPEGEVLAILRSMFFIGFGAGVAVSDNILDSDATDDQAIALFDALWAELAGEAVVFNAQTLSRVEVRK